MEGLIGSKFLYLVFKPEFASLHIRQFERIDAGVGKGVFNFTLEIGVTTLQFCKMRLH